MTNINETAERDVAAFCEWKDASMSHSADWSSWKAGADYARAALAQQAAVPEGWQLVPKEPTAEILAGACIAAWPAASAGDLMLAKEAATVVLMKMDSAPGVTLDMVAANIATMAPAYRAMLAAAPEAPAALDVEAMLLACVPGGSICDPQQIADNIREYLAAAPEAPAAQGQQSEVAAEPVLIASQFLAAMRAVKSNLMHQRRFGNDTMMAWRNAAARAEGDIEEAIAACTQGVSR